MNKHSLEIININESQSFSDIKAIAKQFSAKAAGDNAVLYSGKVGETSSNVFAKEIAEGSQYSIIDKTPRAEFLSDELVHSTIKDRATYLFRKMGMDGEQAKAEAASFIFGDAKAPADSPTSLKKQPLGRSIGRIRAIAAR